MVNHFYAETVVYCVLLLYEILNCILLNNEILSFIFVFLIFIDNV